MNKPFYKRGFTLLEMLVVIAIFLIFTVIMLADYKDFGAHEKFINFAYDTALNLRQIQTSGIAVKETGTGSNVFSGGYGIHFSPSTNLHAYTTFVDEIDDVGSENRYFDESDTIVKEITVDPDYSVSSVCAVRNKVETEDCATSSGGVVDIVFIRPNPDAYISFNGCDGSDDCNSGSNPYSGANIHLTSSKDDPARTIYVDITGQISIK